jgi:hypothetical protein
MQTRTDGFTMYVQAVVARQMHEEMLERAQRYRVASRVQALNRARRKLVRAQRQMSRARVQASRLRQELEAEA